MAEDALKLRLYDTLRREKVDFTPLDPANVRMYVCGPTVYDYAHIGNARPVIVFDVLYRLLRHLYGAEHVTYVRNITDVDDKINARAAERFRDEIAARRLTLNAAIRRLTDETAAQFEKDVTALGCLKPDVEPRATDNVAEMIGLIQKLLDNGHAYAATGTEGHEVLFDVASMPDYGELSKRPLEEQQAGARVAVEAHKKNPGDFVLWKESGADEPGWPAEFRVGGDTVAITGRPGWHIECSAMSDKFLWELVGDRLSPAAHAHPHVFDIHGGGIDLVFPHHENEIAQTRSAFGTTQMAQVWMHNGFLQVEGRKMSKSLGNFVTINELLETEKFGGRRWPGEVLRLAMLMTHYREPIDFSVARLEEAEAVLDGWYRAVGDVGVEEGVEHTDAVTALLDDLGTPGAVAALHELRAEAARGGAGAKESLKASAGLLGLLQTDATAWFSGAAAGHTPTEAIEAEIVRRLDALASKDFAKADAIRAELLGQGVQLMDYKDPETGERRTRWEVKR